MTPGIETHRVAAPPNGQGTDVLVLLHGRGSNEEDLLGLRPWMPDHVTVVTPRAPFPGAPWGYGPGWAWYRYLEDDRMEPGTLDTSLAALDAFLEALPDHLGFTPRRRILGGFSQGGTLSLAWALTRPGQAERVLNLSGFLAGVPAVQGALSNAKGLPVFWGHGRADPAIPFALAERGRKALDQAGAALELFDHPSGHTITPDEVTAIRRFVEGDRGTAEGDGAPAS
jgi:phospholipase/carboxylesterase